MIVAPAVLPMASLQPRKSYDFSVLYIDRAECEKALLRVLPKIRALLIDLNRGNALRKLARELSRNQPH